MVGEPWDGTMDENLARRLLLRHSLLLVAFSLSEATRKRGKRRRLLLTHAGRRSLSDISSVWGEENETSSCTGRRDKATFVDPQDACSAIAAESYKLWLEHENRTDDITVIVVQIKDMVAVSSTFC
ncbi:hypothetical protein GW17_00018877 [Ensete ventricosum]|nr:hypothetical protein GW17_00018877 [Ensete ventricosum]RZS15711.1 hypothetical protein BHM03_00047579 [Ensete ventricosum]